MNKRRRHELLELLVGELARERGQEMPPGMDDEQLWDSFRALVNTRPPAPVRADLLAAQDELLQGINAEAGRHGIDETLPSPIDSRLRLWRGDITTLSADAIVNAANSRLLGCFQPGHYCIDNAIHTFAGMQLRLECDRLMREQGHDELTGYAKITAAYNLPATHVIHTVGPIANGNPTEQHCDQLASCYRSCLQLAANHGLKSVAFCCISTGVFGFPQEEAAPIAVFSVRRWMAENPVAAQEMKVVFNVFGDHDEFIYRQLLGLNAG